MNRCTLTVLRWLYRTGDVPFFVEAGSVDAFRARIEAYYAPSSRLHHPADELIHVALDLVEWTLLYASLMEEHRQHHESIKRVP